MLLACSIGWLSYGQENGAKLPWKGYAILGNGHLTAVYSDDARISALTHSQGIQHFYFKDYTADYISSTSFDLLDENGQSLEPSAVKSVGMKNFFTTQTQTHLSNGSSKNVLCFIHPEDAAVLSVSGGAASAKSRYRFQALLRREIKTDQVIILTSLHDQENIAVAVWSNGTVLAIAPKSLTAKVTVNQGNVSCNGSLSGQSSRAEVLLIPASSRSEALSKVRLIAANGRP